MKEIGIIGFGNQAKAWALNLRDSGYDVSIYLRKGSQSKIVATSLGFETKTIGEELPLYTALLTPDETHNEVLEKFNHQKNKVIIYAHGYSLLYEAVSKKYSQFDHILCAPKAIASELRWQYEIKGAIGGVFSCEFSKDAKLHNTQIKKIAQDLGLTLFFETTVEQETKADLFSEQSLLCSTIPYACLASFSELRRRGISKEVAFFETWHEFKLITDTFIKLGPDNFFNLISPNALLGSQIGKDLLFSQEYTDSLKQIFDNIENENFSSLIKNTNFEDLRKKILNFWEKQELTQTFNEFKNDLYP